MLRKLVYLSFLFAATSLFGQAVRPGAPNDANYVVSTSHISLLNPIVVNNVSTFSSWLGISGTPSSTTFLRGDFSWQTPPGGTAAAGGSNTQFQFNNSGVLDGTIGFTWNLGTQTATIPTMAATTLIATNLEFEGTTVDGNELSIVVQDPTADRTVTYRNASGTHIISGDTLTGQIVGTLDTDGSTSVTLNTPDAGSVGEQLTTDGSGNLDWGPAGGGTGGDIVSPLTAPEISLTSAATTPTLSRFHVCSGGSSFTIPLPPVSGNAGKFMGFRGASTFTQTATLDANGAETINGLSTYVVRDNDAVILICDGTTWAVVSWMQFTPEFQSLTLFNGTTSAGTITLFENQATGFENLNLRAPTSISTSYNLTLPPDDGDPGEQMTTDGSGNTTWGGSDVAQIACSDMTTAITAGTSKAYWPVPRGCTVNDIRARAFTAPTGADIIIDVKETGGTLMTTNKVRIQAGQKSTETSTPQPTLTDTTLADDAEVTVDFVQVGSTVAGAGIIVSIYYSW